MGSERTMVQYGRDRVQLGAWKSSVDVANLVPYPAHDVLSADAVAHAVDSVAAHGYRAAYTSAMTPEQAVPFIAAGFVLVEELHLLRRPVDEAPSPGRGGLRRGRRGDYDQVLVVDALAFDPFWRFDRSSLVDAMRATPRHRFGVTRDAPVAGYHISGLAGANVYLQRVAVHPDHQGQGWGTQLVHDALRWGWRLGARQAQVNTQISNERAVALYRRCGFTAAPYRLQVLRLN